MSEGDAFQIPLGIDPVAAFNLAISPDYRTILDSPHVFAGVLLVLALAVAFNAALKWIERKAAIWHTGTRSGQGAANAIASRALQPAS